MEDKEHVSKEREKLHTALDTVTDELKNAQSKITDMKIEYEVSLSKLREEHQEFKQRADHEIETARAEIEKLKGRCDFLWQSIADKSEDSRRSTPSVEVNPIEEKREDSDILSELSSSEPSRAPSPHLILPPPSIAKSKNPGQPKIQAEEVNVRRVSGWGEKPSTGSWGAVKPQVPGKMAFGASAKASVAATPWGALAKESAATPVLESSTKGSAATPVWGSSTKGSAATPVWGSSTKGSAATHVWGSSTKESAATPV